MKFKIIITPILFLELLFDNFKTYKRFASTIWLNISDARIGGTALPTCLYWLVFVPRNIKSSAKDCRRAFSRTVGIRL